MEVFNPDTTNNLGARKSLIQIYEQLHFKQDTEEFILVDDNMKHKAIIFLSNYGRSF